VEGVVVEENSVLGMGVFLGQSTKIYHRASGEVTYGRVPAGSVVVAGSLPSGDRGCHLYCAVIVKQVDARTRAKTSINELLRSGTVPITLKSPADAPKMRTAGALAAEVLDYIAPHVVAGVTTGELDRLCHDYMVNVQNTIPAPLNYAPPG